MAWKFDNPWRGSNSQNSWDIQGQEAEKVLAVNSGLPPNPKTISQISNYLPYGDESDYMKIASMTKQYKTVIDNFSIQNAFNLLFIEGHASAAGLDGEAAVLKFSAESVNNFFRLTIKERESSLMFMCIKLRQVELINDPTLITYLDMLKSENKGLYLVVLESNTIKSFKNSLAVYQSVNLNARADNIETLIHELYCHVYLDIKFGKRYEYGKPDAHKYYYASQQELSANPLNAVFSENKYNGGGYLSNFDSATQDSVYFEVKEDAKDIIKTYTKK